jgi:hypothetical protein
MGKTFKKLTVINLILYANNVFAGIDTTLYPIDYEYMYNVSKDMVEAYTKLKTEISLKKPKSYNKKTNGYDNTVNKFFIYAKYSYSTPFSGGSTPAVYDILVPTNHGTFKSELQSFNMAANISYQFNRIDIGYRFLMDELELLAGPYDNKNLSHFFSENNPALLINWSYGFVLHSLYFSTSKGFAVDVGLLVGRIPISKINESGKRVFSLDTTDKDFGAEGTAYRPNLSLSAEYNGFKSSFIYGSGKPLKILKFHAPHFTIWNGIKASPQMAYYAYNNRWQTGANAHTPILSSRFELEMDSKIDLRKSKSNDYGIFGHILLDGNIYLFNEHESLDAIYGNNDFFILINSRVSYSSDLLEKKSFGYGFSISFHEIFKILKVEIGRGRSDYKSMYMVPMKANHIWNFLAEIAW